MGAETWDRHLGEWEGGDKKDKEKGRDGSGIWENPDMGEAPSDEIPEDAEIGDLPELVEIPVTPDIQDEDVEAVIRQAILNRINPEQPIKPADDIDKYDIN